MEQIKELTKRLIANSFKELMMQVSFEKITIKMITDHASVIRPTFYNHFHDKYDLVEWILCSDILDDFRSRLEEGKIEEGVTLLFTGFFGDMEYYGKAFEIGGQNGFLETLTRHLQEAFLNAFQRDKNLIGPDPELLCQYYANALITTLRYAMKKSPEAVAQDALKDFNFIMSHNLYDLF